MAARGCTWFRELALPVLQRRFWAGVADNFFRQSPVIAYMKRAGVHGE